MFDHVGIHVSDLEASKAFYVAALSPLGCRLLAEHGAGGSRWLVFGSGEAEPFFVVASSPDRDAKPIHLAWVAPSEEAVERFHEAGLAAGGADNGAPGPRPARKPYYAAFLHDPDGNNVEAGYRETA